MNQMFAEFPSKLRQLRESRNWTLEKVAEEAGLAKSSVWSLENGAQNPRLETVCQLAEAFRVTPAVFFLEPSDCSVEDQYFFQQYLALNSETKKKVRDFLIIIGD